MDTGYYSYSTGADGLCCFDTEAEAVRAAEGTGERGVKVYNPTGRPVYTTKGGPYTCTFCLEPCATRHGHDECGPDEEV